MSSDVIPSLAQLLLYSTIFIFPSHSCSANIILACDITHVMYRMGITEKNKKWQKRKKDATWENDHVPLDVNRGFLTGSGVLVYHAKHMASLN